MNERWSSGLYLGPSIPGVCWSLDFFRFLKSSMMYKLLCILYILESSLQELGQYTHLCVCMKCKDSY